MRTCGHPWKSPPTHTPFPFLAVGLEEAAALERAVDVAVAEAVNADGRLGVAARHALQRLRVAGPEADGQLAADLARGEGVFVLRHAQPRLEGSAPDEAGAARDGAVHLLPQAVEQRRR
jgi:hypothetical protein